MNTVYGKLLLWSVLTVIVGFLAIAGVHTVLDERNQDRGKGPGDLDALFLDQAVEAYQTDGVERLKTEMARIDRHMPGLHYLTDGRGRDLVTGDDRSALLTGGGGIVINRSPG